MGTLVLKLDSRLPRLQKTRFLEKRRGIGGGEDTAVYGQSVDDRMDEGAQQTKPLEGVASSDQKGRGTVLVLHVKLGSLSGALRGNAEDKTWKLWKWVSSQGQTRIEALHSVQLSSEC